MAAPEARVALAGAVHYPLDQALHRPLHLSRHSTWTIEDLSSMDEGEYVNSDSLLTIIVIAPDASG